MKDFFSKLLLFFVDIASITLALWSSVFLVEGEQGLQYGHLFSFGHIYLITLAVFFYEGLYTNRYDFWHESKLILKSILFSTILSLAYMSLTHPESDLIDRYTLLYAYFFMTFLIPSSKRITKYLLYKTGLWKKAVKIIGDDANLKQEILENFYLGYTQEDNTGEKTIIISSKNRKLKELQQVINLSLEESSEIIFIPLFNDFDLTNAKIYELFNIRTNMIKLQNRLKNRFRKIVKYLFDYLILIFLIPVALPLFLVIAAFIKHEGKLSSIFFRQPRLGKNGRVFYCYKFKTMVDNGEDILQEYFRQHPEEETFFKKYHKLKNDPRVTPVGRVLRKTSLDELPQIINVLRGEMSFIGPRPYMLNETPKLKEYKAIILSVRPGITGLWQVSGRNQTDFTERMAIEVWYIRNWSLWLDVVILTKTVKTVLAKRGAY